MAAVRSGMCALVLVAIVAFVYWPGVHGFWGRDDFMQLAFARLIGSPWPLFTHDPVSTDQECKWRPTLAQDR